MKGLLQALWTDPKVASGFGMMLLSMLGFILANPHDNVSQVLSTIGSALVNLAGGGLLLHATAPVKDKPKGPYDS